jgi:hypothetical protein
MIGSWAVVLGEDATVGTQHEFNALCISKHFPTVGSVQRSQWQSVLQWPSTPRGGLTRRNKA